MIKLPAKSELNDVIQPINGLACKTASDPEVMELIAMGNGATSAKLNEVSPILQFIKLKTTSKTRCINSYPWMAIHKSIWCAEGDQLLQSSCEGDSGSPIIDVKTKNLIGITSLTPLIGCKPGSPTGIVYVPDFIEWIIATTKTAKIVHCQK